MAQSSLIHIGIAGSVLALDRATGEEVWRTRLGGDFVNLAVEDGALFAACKGEVFCLDPATGHVRWHNQLKGLGRGLVSIAQAGGHQPVAALEKKRRDDEAAATAAITATGA